MESRRSAWVFAGCMLLALSGAGCGGASSQATTERPAAADEHALGATGAWTEVDRAELARIVRDEAIRSVRARQPDFDEAMLVQWLRAPHTAPELDNAIGLALLRLVLTDVVEGKLDRAEQIIRLVRARSIDRHMAFVGAEIIAEIGRARAGRNRVAQERAIRSAFAEVPLPRMAEATRAATTFPNEEALRMALEPVYRAPVRAETASAVLFMGYFLPRIVRAANLYIAVVRSILRERLAEDPAHYPYSRVELAVTEQAREVRVAVWDVGTSPALFEDRLFTNPREQADGRDEDGNGQIDDVHGLVSDGNAPNTAFLYEPQIEDRQRYIDLLVGVQRLRAGLEWLDGATEAAAMIRELSSEEQRVSLEHTLEDVMEWTHGTHVASTMLEGNPFARLAIFRSAWAGEVRVYRDRGPTDAELDRERDNMRAVAAFIRTHGIRIVNVSLGFDRKMLEQALVREGRYQNPAALARRVEEVHARRAAHWRDTLSACPDTLFVTGAGNDGDSMAARQVLPAVLDAPNVLVVGALDPWGAWAVFTNYDPQRVVIFDEGVEVVSATPDGQQLPLSGTSMAAPHVANLAAKLLAVDPSLGPGELKQRILETSDTVRAPYTGRIPNAERALSSTRAAARAM